MSLERVVVVGASAAGVHAAEELRVAGYEGSIVLIDAETDAPHDRPPLSKQFLAGDWETDQVVLRQPATYADLEIELHPGWRATGLDPVDRVVHTAAGVALPYDGVVLATGSTARWPTNLPRLRGMHTLRSLSDARALRDDLAHGPRVAVLGGGLIGAEVAATARRLGLEVALVEAMPVPLARALGPAVGAIVAETHRDHGVDVRCGSPVAAVEGEGRVEALVLEDGSRIAADVVVVGIGAAPTTGWLEDSGIALGDGVLCDAYCATSVPRVMAAGDIARWHHPRIGSTRTEHHAHAVEQGAHAARNLLAGETGGEPYAPVGYAWSDQHDLKIQTLGTQPADATNRLLQGSVADRAFVTGAFRDGVLVGAVGVNARRHLMRAHALIDRAATVDAVAEVYPELRDLMPSPQ